MDILSKKDDEIYELAKPIWDNLVRSSNVGSVILAKKIGERKEKSMLH